MYVREDQILPRLAALAILQAGDDHVRDSAPRGSARIMAPAQAADLIDHLRSAGVSIIYDPATRTLRTDTEDVLMVSIG